MERNIILGTDWWTDCDDVAALRLACGYDAGRVWNLCGVVCSACMEYSAASLNAFLTYEGYGNIPLGIDHAAVDYGGRPPYQNNMAENFPHHINTNEECPDAAQLAIHLLEKMPDRTGEWIELGYPQILAAVTASEYGMELLKRKLNVLWMMAGNWENDGRGRENNIIRAERSRKAASYLFAHFPCPIVFLGWETGASVICGGEGNDPLGQAFRDHGSSGGRSSWDPMTVMLAADNGFSNAGYTIRTGFASSDPDTGENSFRFDENGPHSFVVKAMPDVWFEKRLAERLSKRSNSH